MNPSPHVHTRHPVLALTTLYVLAFVLSWSVWGTTIAEQRSLLSWHIPQSLAFWVALPVAYLLGAAVSGGRLALGEQVRALLRWRAGWRWYAVAILIALALPLTGLVARQLSGAGPADPTDILTLRQVPQALLVETALFWLTEEAAWRGFALPRFEQWLSPAWSGLVVGVAWALWHLPLFAIAGSFQSNLPFEGFFVLTVATSLILTWLYHVSGGSVVLCAVYHGVVDVTFASTGVLSASPASFWTVVGAHVVVAGLLWARSAALREPAGAATP